MQTNYYFGRLQSVSEYEGRCKIVILCKYCVGGIPMGRAPPTSVGFLADDDCCPVEYLSLFFFCCYGGVGFCHNMEGVPPSTARAAIKILGRKTFGDGGYRSPYLSHAKRALYHLSYVPLPCRRQLKTRLYAL